MAGDAAVVVGRARELGLLVVAAGADVVRLLPSLNIPDEEIDRGVELLEEALN
ncbi:acetylornithine aminotransferase [compost metagenome]